VNLWHSRYGGFQGGGRYNVTFTVDAGADASVVEGETVFGPAGPAVVVEPFVRSYSTSFYVRAPSVPCPDRDCDGDGIIEDDVDSDDDGLSDPWDPDSDNDEVPDSVEGTDDPDGDTIPNLRDPDSDDDGVIDGIDPDPYGAVPAPRRGRLFYSYHVGSAHPLHDLDSSSDAGIHAGVDLGFPLAGAFAVRATAGLNQFTAETPLGIDNPRWINTSLGLQAGAIAASGVRYYVRADAGLYWPKSGPSDIGFDVGVGGQIAIAGTTHVEFGVDLHRVEAREPVYFLVWQLGVVFR
jgi:hypothetical protein